VKERRKRTNGKEEKSKTEKSKNKMNKWEKELKKEI
jgi:hypothetical protein